jgi:hypothetical protein
MKWIFSLYGRENKKILELITFPAQVNGKIQFQIALHQRRQLLTLLVDSSAQNFNVEKMFSVFTS